MTIARLALKLLINSSSASISIEKGLAESIASITIICSLDREGTIAYSHPIVEELSIIQDDGVLFSLDVTEDMNLKQGIRFEDNDWETFIL